MLTRSLAALLSLCALGACAPAELIDHGSMRMERPEPGMRVWGEVLFADGRTETLDVRTDDDGTVQVEHGISAAATASASTSAPGPCADTGSSLMGHHWEQRFDWWFKASSNPGGTTTDRTEQALIAATTNITRGDNSCSMPDEISATHQYQGRTTTSSQVRSDGGCNAGDGKNVVAFSDLPAGVLGLACVWSTIDGVAVESDVKLNSVDFRFTNDPGSSACSNRFDVESVMTHERGHTFGLGHVGEGQHGKLTMSTAIDGPCQASERSLGKGDVQALRSLY